MTLTVGTIRLVRASAATACLLGVVFIAAPPLQAQLPQFVERAFVAGVADSAWSYSHAWGDYDRDGFVDLFVSFVGRPHILYRNRGDGTFEDTSAQAGMIDDVRPAGEGVVWADYDNDGDLDLFVTNGCVPTPLSPNVLYRNNGNSTFTVVTEAAGLHHIGNTEGTAWADYDLDGFLDLYVGHLETGTPNPGNFLYRNNRDGTFTNVAAAAGVNDLRDSNGGVAWSDYDNDGYPDVYVANRNQTNALFRNNRNGTFTDVAPSLGVQGGANTEGVAWGDYDNDGWMDLFLTTINAGSKLYRNNRNGTFTDVTVAANVDLPGFGVGANWADFDNDGWLDVFVVNINAPNRLLRNNRDGTFTDVAASVGLLLSTKEDDRVGGWADIDNDGFLDLFVSNFTGLNRLFRNGGNGNRWLVVRTIGVNANRDGIGARVEAVAVINGQTVRQLREVSSGGSRHNQDSLPLEFGLGDATDVELTVTFPGRQPQRWGRVGANQMVVIREGESVPEIGTAPASRVVASGASAVFTVAASGAPAPGVQWQVSGNSGVTWTNLAADAIYSGVATDTLTVASAATLNAYQYRAVVTNNAGSATSPSATLTVHGPAAIGPQTVRFGATKSGGTLTSVTPAQLVRVSFAGAASAWTATANQPWVQLTGASGGGAGTFAVAIANPGDVIGAASERTATITLTPATPGVPVATASVALSVRPDADGLAPFGAFDTPVNGAAIAGAVAITGWALDDVEVSRVEIWRDRVIGESTPGYPGPGPGNGKVFIANAFFVEGARPDVETLHAAAPLARRAGWGYLLLTQGLHQGNGAFTLYAFAYDADGRSATLGSKTVSVNNATAAMPFGSIDTPAYGQTVTGSLWNFGWALTPNRTPSCAIGATGVQVSIDSGPLLPVTYGGARMDIAAAFPGLTNSTGAGGAYYFDTTTLTNGTHQIGWYVVDSCNRAEGIGSRFFTVLNQGSGTRDQGSGIRDPGSGISDQGSGIRRIVIRQGERVEIPLAVEGGVSAGYQVVNGERRALPLGSSLDVAAGMFYWEPAPGFLGAYDLEFAGANGEAIAVRAVVGTSIEVVIDTPSAGLVSPAFTISGWAIDQAAMSGSGVDAVHVWAYPSRGGAPILLGVAEYGDGRSDVGQLFGEQFSGAAFNLRVDGTLPPGTYRIVVYPHSTVTGAFGGAKVVLVTIR